MSELYPTPDDIEFYPGIQVEEAKKPWFPASGLCPGYTISVAILADAVALCRGDRFYTTDYTPANLTKWGYVTSLLSPFLYPLYCYRDMLN